MTGSSRQGCLIGNLDTRGVFTDDRLRQRVTWRIRDGIPDGRINLSFQIDNAPGWGQITPALPNGDGFVPVADGDVTGDVRGMGIHRIISYSAQTNTMATLKQVKGISTKTLF
jgi:hypothetical protein